MGLRIGFLTPEYSTPSAPEGGLANYVKKTASLLSARNHKVTVFVLTGQNRSWNDGNVTIIEVKKSAQSFPLLNEYSPIWNQYRSAQRISEAVMEYLQNDGLDLIQTSSYMTPGLTLVGNHRIPLICRISSYTPILRSAYGSALTLSESQRDKMEIRQVRNADASFAPSDFMAKTFEPLLGRRPEVIRSPIDVVDIKQDDSLYREKFSGFCYFLFFGNISPVKGADLIGQAIPEVSAQHPEIRYVFIGRDDGNAFGEKLMDRIRNNSGPDSDKVHFLPPIPRDQLFAVIRNSLAVLMPSRVDNYPNACLEAFSAGSPVIGTYNSSLEEMIEDQKTGFLIANGSSTELAEAMKRMIRLNADEMGLMKQNIRNRTALLEKEDPVGRLEQFYSRVIEDYRRKND